MGAATAAPSASFLQHAVIAVLCRSRLVRNVQAFTASGGNELVLSGINLGRWGRDLTPQRTLEDLVGAIWRRPRCPVCVSVLSSRWTGRPGCWPCFVPIQLPPAPGSHDMPISRCNPDPTPFSAPCTAAIALGTMRKTAPHSREHTGGSDRRRRDGGLSGRERSPL